MTSVLKTDSITAATDNTDLVLTGNGTGNVSLPSGTQLGGTTFGTAATLNAGSGSGDLLRTDGSGANLTGIPADFVLLLSGTLSAASSLAIEGSSYINDDYVRYILHYEQTSDVTATPRVTFREESTGTYFSANYYAAQTGVGGSGSSQSSSTYNTAYVDLGFTFFHPNHSGNIEMTFHALRASDVYSSLAFHGGYPEDFYSKTAVAYGIGGVRNEAVIDGVKWTPSANSFTGRYWWYGLKGA